MGADPCMETGEQTPVRTQIPESMDIDMQIHVRTAKTQIHVRTVKTQIHVRTVKTQIHVGGTQGKSHAGT